MQMTLKCKICNKEAALMQDREGKFAFMHHYCGDAPARSPCKGPWRIAGTVSEMAIEVATEVISELEEIANG